MATGWDDEPLDTAMDSRQLELGGDEARLPWLESTDDDDEDQNPGALRLLIFAGAGLVLVALLAGAAWWFLHGRHAAALPEGATIRAPATAYKARPADPGGRDFAGTGDTAYAVSAGEVRTARLATGDDGDTAPAPPQPSAAPSAAATPSPNPTASAAPAAGGAAVQVGAYSSAAAAEAGWSKLVAQHDILSGHSHRVVRASADIGTIYRLQAVTPDGAGAQALCGQLKGAGVSCQVK